MGEGALPRGGVKGSQGGHGGRRGGPQKAEDPHLDGTGEKNPWHCGKGLGLRRSRAVCHTRVPESTPSWSLGSFSGPGQNPRAPDHTHHARGSHGFKTLQTEDWGWGWGGSEKEDRGLTKSLSGSPRHISAPRGLSPLGLAPHLLHSLSHPLLLFQVLSYEHPLQTPSPSILSLRSQSQHPSLPTM